MEWNFSSGSSVSAHTKYIDLSSIPATQVDKGSGCGGVVLLIFAVFWGGIPTAALISAMAAGKLRPDVVLILFFSVSGAGMFIGGVHLLFSSTTTTIDVERVSVTKKSLFGMTQWSEYISAYEGVQSRSEYHARGKSTPAYTLYIIELRHKDPKKTVRLYQSSDNEMFRVIWEDYCQKLNIRQ